MENKNSHNIDIKILWEALNEEQKFVLKSLNGSPRLDVAGLLLINVVNSMYAAVNQMGMDFYKFDKNYESQFPGADIFKEKMIEAGKELLVVSLAVKGDKVDGLP